MAPRLFRYCREDASTHCHAQQSFFISPESPDATVPEKGRLVFACLYRTMKSKRAQLTRPCAFEVRRLMKQRAVSVELEPRIQEPCLQDLGYYCSKNTEKGEEIECLQKNLAELEPECKSAVANFTQDEDEEIELDKIIMKSCTPMIKRFCEALVKKVGTVKSLGSVKEYLNKEDGEAGEVMQCLIQFKHHADMNRKCAASIEHHQLIALKDYTFSYKFKEACKQDVVSLCTQGVKKKSEVIKCLSEKVRDDILTEETHRISRKCRKQLRFELLERGENIELDPRLKDACQQDRKELCSNITPGKAQVIECLMKHKKELSNNCHVAIFKRQKDQARDPTIDFTLMTTCKRMVQRYCADTDRGDMFQCLRQKKDEDDFDAKCRRIIIERERSKRRDIRLNPILKKSCRMDIPKFCKDQMEQADKSDKDIEGKVIMCLRIKFSQKKLSSDCESHVRTIIKESAMDYRQDPALASACKTEISTHCMHEMVSDNEADDDKGRVTECLRGKLLEMKHIKEGKIQHNAAAGELHFSPQCKAEVARVLAEDRADVQVDPLLHRACAVDLKHYCFDVPPGEGRQMSCLLAALEDRKVRLQQQCHKMLNDRVKMWEYAAKVAPPETLGELMVQVATSRSKTYFITVIFAVIGFIFIGGLFCGRVTKRVRAELKNK